MLLCIACLVIFYWEEETLSKLYIFRLVCISALIFAIQFANELPHIKKKKPLSLSINNTSILRSEAIMLTGGTAANGSVSESHSLIFSRKLN